MQGYYSNIVKGYNELYGQEQLEKARIIKENIEIKGLLLDIGAGTGVSTELFKDKATCVLLDPSFEMLKSANGIRICGKAENLPFQDKTFDTIISITSLHHCDIKRALKEIKRVAKGDADIALTILKRSKAAKDLSLFKDFRIIEHEKDYILIKSSKHVK